MITMLQGNPRRLPMRAILQCLSLGIILSSPPYSTSA